MSQFTKFWKGNVSFDKAGAEQAYTNLAHTAKENGMSRDEVKRHIASASRGTVDVDKIVNSVFGKIEDENETEKVKKSTFHVGQIVTSEFSEIIEDCKIISVYNNEEYELKGLESGETFRAREADITSKN